jgi:hypothetical protein
MKGEILRADGTREPFEGDPDELRVVIDAPEGFDTVNLRDGRFMYVADLGHPRGLPVNPEATKLYLAVCLPGTTHHIVGDVAVIEAKQEPLNRAESADSGTSEIQSEGGGANPTSALVFDRSWRLATRVAAIGRREADPLIKRHYLGKWPGTCVCILGMWYMENLRGIVTFSLPPRETAKRYGGETWELSRLWVDDAVPRNAESWLLAQSVRLVRRSHPSVRYLVSYADPSHGHQGTIYRAAGWRSDGWTDAGRLVPRSDYVDAATGKKYGRRSHVPIGVTLRRVPRNSKYRFKLVLRTEWQA